MGDNGFAVGQVICKKITKLQSSGGSLYFVMKVNRRQYHYYFHGFRGFLYYF